VKIAFYAIRGSQGPNYRDIAVKYSDQAYIRLELSSRWRALQRHARSVADGTLVELPLWPIQNFSFSPLEAGKARDPRQLRDQATATAMVATRMSLSQRTSPSFDNQNQPKWTSTCGAD
jgi:hypothetical protein